MTALQMSAYFKKRGHGYLPWTYLPEVTRRPVRQTPPSSQAAPRSAPMPSTYSTGKHRKLAPCASNAHPYLPRRTSRAVLTRTQRASPHRVTSAAEGKTDAPEATASAVRATHKSFCFARCSCLPIVMSVRRFPTALVSLQSITFTTSLNVMAITPMLATYVVGMARTWEPCSGVFPLRRAFLETARANERIARMKGPMFHRFWIPQTQPGGLYYAMPSESVPSAVLFSQLRNRYGAVKRA